MQKKKVGLVLGALALTVGFAAVSTTLYINGTATIKANNDDFKNNIKFTAASIDQASIDAGATAPTISADGKTITFVTKEFSTIGDKTTLNYTVTNSSNYKAQFETPAIVCTSTDTAYATYLNVKDGKALDGKLLDRQGSADDTLEVSLKQSYAGEQAKSITYTCTIDVAAVEASN